LLDFANTKTLDPRITFTRASTASFYDGKTVAKAEENLFLNSEDIASNWSKVQCVATANTTVAPNGTTTGDTFTANAFTGTIYVQYSLTPVGATTISIFAKAGTHPYIQILNASDAQAFANFDLTAGAGVVGTKGSKTTSSIVDAGSGWYRCIATFDATTTLGASNRIYFAPSASATYGQAITAAGTETIILWGAQLEQRSSVTAYTATTTAAITNYIPALQTAASGVARFEHNPTTGESLGLEIEEQRTNLVLRSDDFANAAWTSGSQTVSSNVAIAPDGTLTAEKLIANTGTIYQSVTIANSTNYTWSIYAKAGEKSWLRLLAQDTVTLLSAYFNLATGTIGTVGSGATATITAVGNGWYRCTISKTSASTSGFFNFGVVDGDNTTVSTGNGFSGIYIWGAQLEAGAFATSYIPTVASQVTRSADSASMTGSNFSSWFRADEGTLYTESQLPTLQTGGNPRVASLSDNTNNNEMSTLYALGTPALGFNAKVNNSFVAILSTTVASSAITSASKNAAAYRVNDFAMSVNGATVATDTAGAIPIVNRLNIGAGPIDISGSQGINGNIRKIAYYAKRLTNAELVSLTTI
jgi:hypothetical protein